MVSCFVAQQFPREVLHIPAEIGLVEIVGVESRIARPICRSRALRSGAGNSSPFASAVEYSPMAKRFGFLEERLQILPL